MKNIFSPRFKPIHPSYFELAQESVTSKKPQRSSLDTILKISKVTALSSLTLLFLSLLLSREQSHALVPPARQFDGPEYHAVQQQFEQVGEILDFLLAKTDGAGPPSASNARKDRTAQTQTCRVNVAKALLRVGPGKNFSPLMAVSEGYELLVDGEKDDWLQVVSPTGEAAWISKDVVI